MRKPVCGFACMCDATTRRRVAAAAVSPVGGFACMFVHDTRGRFRYVPDVIRTLATIVCCRCLWHSGRSLFAGCRNFCLPRQRSCSSACTSSSGLWVPRLWLVGSLNFVMADLPASETGWFSVARIWVHSKCG